MSNQGMIGGFQDLEQAAFEQGQTPSQQNKVQTPVQDSFLANNPYLKPAEINYGPQPEQKINFQYSEVSQEKKPLFPSNGELRFDQTSISPEHRIQMLKQELEQLKDEPQEEVQVDEEEKESSPIIPPKIQKAGLEYAISTGQKIHKAAKGIFGFFQEFFGAFKNLVQEKVVFKIYTPEQKKKMDEVKKKKAEQAATQREFHQASGEERGKVRMQEMQNLQNLEDRLEITGLSTEQRNKYLGRTRNLSNTERNIHLSHFTAYALIEEREVKLKEQKDIKMAETQSKASPLDLNKVAEGGSILSSTGGQGAG